MALSTTNNYLQSLISAGADAQSNLYLVKFTGGELTNVNQDLMVRCTGFTPPTISQNSYPVKFLTATIDRPTAKVEVTRRFSLTFRVDANYKAYKAILKQQSVTSNMAQSFVATDIQSLSKNNKLFTVKVEAVDEGVTDATNISSTNLFKFDKCWITAITPPSYTTGDATAAEVTVNISFLTMEDLQTGSIS